MKLQQSVHFDLNAPKTLWQRVQFLIIYTVHCFSYAVYNRIDEAVHPRTFWSEPAKDYTQKIYVDDVNCTLL